MTQKQQVIKYFEKNNNKQKHFKTIANDLDILVPNMRRILGQGTLKGIFTRVAKGIYKLNNQDIKPDFKNVINKNNMVLRRYYRSRQRKKILGKINKKMIKNIRISMS